MTPEKKERDIPNLDLIIETMLKEYEILRNEIDVYHSHQEKIMMYSLITLGALFSYFVYIKDNSLSFVLLLFPLLFTIYAYLFADKTVRILRISDYIHNVLGEKLRELLGADLLQWEDYKQVCPLFPADKSIYLDITRWSIFIVPGVMSLCLYYGYFGSKLNNITEIILLVIDIFLLLLLSVFIYNINETKGISSRVEITKLLDKKPKKSSTDKKVSDKVYD